MPSIARMGDLIVGGVHCHGSGHPYAPIPTPGRIREGSTKVCINGRPVARAGDQGYSPCCCAGIGKIVVQQSQAKVFINDKPIATVGSPTIHCDTATGVIQTGSAKFFC